MAERQRNGFTWKGLHAGDLVKIAYQHRSPGRHELTLGDFCYAIGYVVKIRPSRIILSNINPNYCGRPSCFSLLEKRVAYMIDNVDGIVRLQRGRESENSEELLESEVCYPRAKP